MKLTSAFVRVALRRVSGKFSKLMRYLTGESGFQRDGWSLDEGVALLTSQNPRAKLVSPEENRELYDELKQDLKGSDTVYFQQEGQYNVHEESVAMFRVSRKHAADVSRKYRQESFVWVGQNEDGTMYYEFWADYNDDGEYTQDMGQRLEDTMIQDASDFENFYSEIKRRKYSIPFFRDDPPPQRERSRQREEVVNVGEGLV